jgi:GNAT superfamily N-acetyltransferase
MTVEIRSLMNEDLGVASVILDSAYGPGPGRVERVRRYLAVEPDGWCLALVEGEPAGIGGALDFTTFAYVGLVGVLADMQRRGVGRAVMHHLLSWLERRGCPSVLLDASDAGEPLYRQLGFVVSDRVNVFTGAKARPATRPAAAGPRVAALEGDDLDAVVALDRRITGGDRRGLLRAYAADFAGRVFVARNMRRDVLGYAVAQRLSIGPWLATDALVAGRLLDAALALDFDEPPVVAAPDANRTVDDVLVDRGFSRVRSLAHMRLGPEPVRRRDLVFGQASLAAG